MRYPTIPPADLRVEDGGDGVRDGQEDTEDTEDKEHENEGCHESFLSESADTSSRRSACV